ncbi:MAG: ATP-binding protein [Candidatus Competibacter sp.]|nr:ATP-binding protein [Candidatus Competibacter sp.]
MSVDPEPSSRTASPAAGDWLVGGGEMGNLIRAIDWSRTPLGPIASWPPGLRTTVSLALNSNFPISLAWGPRHTQIYNDGYWPICAAKHPTSMGQDFTECWASAWPAIGAAFASARAGTPAFLEDQRMFLDRLGYLEETFFTFSFSPIRDESGQVAGLFHPVTETTGKMVGQRRTRVLRDVAERAVRARSLDEGLALAAQTLAEAALDLPFVLFYKLDKEGRTAHLAACSGLEPGGPASPAMVDLRRDTAGWPLAQVAGDASAVLVEDVPDRFPGLVCGPYPESIRSAFVRAITLPGHEQPACVLVAGASPRLPLNEAYRAFFELLAAAVATVIANAVAYEAERQRAEALAEIDRAKTAFFSNVSHEFRTPLTLLLAPLEDELAERAAPLPPARRERLLLAHRNSLRLLKLVNSLLDFARIEAGRAQAVYQPTDLAAVTAGLAGNFQSACERAGLRLVVNCPPLPEPVYVDHDLWEKIVLNLLSNAFKFTFEGEIAVDLQPAVAAVDLTVRDTGTGISADELPRVFDRFHRIKGARGRTHEGAGIGLALVKELVALHGGSIRVESVRGRGSAFTVTIPLGQDHLPAKHVGATRTLASTALGATPFVEEALRWLPDSPPPRVATEDALQPEFVPAEDTSPGLAEVPAASPRPRVVWADDNADLRDYVRRLLDDRYAVEAVADGEAALAAARRSPPDLVLSDVMMPRLDGFGLLRDAAGQATRYLGIVMDITARRRTEETLRLQGAALEAAANAIVITDRAGRIEWANQAFSVLTGYSPDEALGRNPRDLVRSGAHNRDFYADLWRTILAGRVWEGEIINRRKDRSQYLEFMTITPVPDQGGAIGHFVAVKQDITARRRAEQALRESEARLRAIVHAIPDGLAVLDEEGRFLEILTTRPHRLLLAPDALLGQRLSDVWPAEGARSGLEALRQTLRTREPQSFEYVWPDGTAAPHVFEARVAPLDEPFMGRPAVILLARDVTQQRLTEASLRQAQKMEAVGQLTGGIAHDFNNLLAVILGNLELLADSLQDRDPEVEDRVREALAAAGRGADLARRLLIFSRRQPLRPQRTDLNRLVIGMGNLLRRSLGETIVLQTCLAPDLLPTVIDPSQLEVALLNLAVNARDAMPDGGQLTIETANYWLHEDAAHAALHGMAAGQYVALAVSDTGRGMTPDVQRWAFEPFFTTKEVGRGTGLGLSMVHGLVEQSGGFVHLYSKVGQGTTVRLHFPAAEAADAGVDAGTSAELARFEPGRQTILVVEDESAVRQLAVRILESLGYRTVEADTAEAALAVLKATPEVAVLFTDVVLPGTASGVDLARQALRFRPDLKILFVSGYAEAHLSRFQDRPEGSDLLDKPYRKAQLAEKLRALLDDGATGKSG